MAAGRGGCSLVLVPRQRRANDESKLELAESFGIPLIQLKLTKFGDSEVGVQGFQSVSIERTRASNGRASVIATYYKDKAGNDGPNGSLAFLPNQFGEMFAWVPDSPFNRMVLASCVLGADVNGFPVQWEIVNDKIRGEIEALAETMKQGVAFKKGEEAVRKARKDNERQISSKHLSSMPESQRTMQTMLETLISAVGAMSTIQATALKEKLVEAQSLAVDVLGKKPTKEQAEKPSDREERETAEVRNTIRDEVYEDLEDVIANLKERYGNRWAQTTEYKQQILSEIEKRYAERTGAVNADDDGTSSFAS